MSSPAHTPPPKPRWHRVAFRYYDTVIDTIIIGVIPLMLLALGFAFIQAFLSMIDLFPLWNSPEIAATSFRDLVEKILDVIILIELFSTFMEYARTHRIRMSSLIDMTIVFTLREMLVLLYSQNFSTTELIALCIVIIVLVIARSITIKLSPATRTNTSD